MRDYDKKILFLLFFMLIIGVQSILAAQRTDSLECSRHEVAVSISGPGIRPIRDASHSTGSVDPSSVDQSYSSKYLPTFYIQYLHNKNRYIGWGVMLSYVKSELKEHKIGNNYTYYNPLTGDRMKAAFDDRYYRNDYLSLGAVFRVYWFHRKHVSMYSKAEAGLTIRFETNTEYWMKWSNKDVWHYKHALPDINISPVCIEFGSTHIRGFVEMACGTSYIGSAGMKYAF